MDTSVPAKTAGLMNAIETALTAAVCLAAVGGLAMSPGAERSYGILVRSGYTAADVIAAAGGSVISISASGAVALARSDDPAFVWHLYVNGAGLVFNPLFAAGCTR
jgi:hypothetical protein